MKYLLVIKYFYITFSEKKGQTALCVKSVQYTQHIYFQCKPTVIPKFIDS